MGVERLMDEYSKSMNEWSVGLKKENSSKQTLIIKAGEYAQSTQQKINQYINNLRQYYPALQTTDSLPAIRDELSKLVQAKQAARDAAMDEKMKQKAVRSELSSQVKQLKEEIDRLNEENADMGTLLGPENKEEDLPLILKLMKSTKV